MTHQVYEVMQNKGLKPGSVVLSRAGHDQGRVYLVIGLQLPFVWLSDGGLRSVTKPKKKRIRHVKPLGDIDWELGSLISENVKDPGQIDATIRTKLEMFITNHQPKEER